LYSHEPIVKGEVVPDRVLLERESFMWR
jgi:hypothetical protein